MNQVWGVIGFTIVLVMVGLLIVMYHPDFVIGKGPIIIEGGAAATGLFWLFLGGAIIGNLLAWYSVKRDHATAQASFIAMS